VAAKGQKETRWAICRIPWSGTGGNRASVGLTFAACTVTGSIRWVEKKKVYPGDLSDGLSSHVKSEVSPLSFKF
jgi:hypothetical protein